MTSKPNHSREESAAPARPYTIYAVSLLYEDAAVSLFYESAAARKTLSTQIIITGGLNPLTAEETSARADADARARWDEEAHGSHAGWRLRCTSCAWAEFE